VFVLVVEALVEVVEALVEIEVPWSGTVVTGVVVVGA
jgi:hypothetical protein